MKHKCISAVLACMLALLLSACAQQAPEAPSPAAPETSAAVATATKADAVPERPEVVGNGGFFVRTDGKVWFRRYDADSFDEPQLWGAFLNTMPGHAVSSQLCCYDTAGGTVTEALPDSGFGALWFGVDGFYLSRPKGESSEAYHKALDGTETVLGEGTVAGVSGNGRFAAVQKDAVTFTVYEGVNEALHISENADFCTFCVLTDDGALVYYAFDNAANEGRLMRLDGSEAQPVRLGILPALPEESTAYGWEFAQSLLDGGNVWCTFGSYEGTGHFLAEALCVRAKLDTPDSLTVVTDQAETDYPFVPKLYRDASGAVCRAEHAPGELEISYENGDLYWFETAERETLLIPSFLPQSSYSDDALIEQTAEVIGDAAYLIVAQAVRDAENDVGWRMAYRPGEMRYLRVPLRENSEVESLDGKTWNTAPSADAVYANCLGTWVLTAVEVEGDRADTLPDDMFEYVYFREDGTVLIDSKDGENSYRNEFSHAEVLPTNSEDAQTAPYGLLLTGGKNDDMMYTFFEGETLVATVMMHFDPEHGGDVISRTGFYERTVG